MSDSETSAREFVQTVRLGNDDTKKKMTFVAAMAFQYGMKMVAFGGDMPKSTGATRQTSAAKA